VGDNDCGAAQAEHVLWSARRQTSQVAILFFRSSEMWDQWHLPQGSPNLCIAACVSSMVARYIDYSAEVYVKMCFENPS
jgi:hypothetical protein